MKCNLKNVMKLRFGLSRSMLVIHHPVLSRANQILLFYFTYVSFYLNSVTHSNKVRYIERSCYLIGLTALTRVMGPDPS